MLIKQIQVTAMAVFCYLVGDESAGRGILIDPAGDQEKILKQIQAHGVTVEWIVNTHGHWDHTAGNEAMARLTGAGILIHEFDAPRLKSWSNRLFSRFLGGRTSPEPVQVLRDNDVISFGAESLTVVHTPGHTEGGICLHTPGHLFTGDTLFTEGCGRTDLPGGSMNQLLDSIRRRILTLPDETIIWPGHNYGQFPTSTVKEQRGFWR